LIHVAIRRPHKGTPLRIRAALLSLLIASGAGASNWIPVTRLPHGTVALDADSVEREGTTVNAWVEFRQATAGQIGVAFERDHWSVDCKDMTVATLATVQYDVTGKVTAGNALSAYYPERTSITPHSVGFQVYRLLCR
jgi:hypothetical protein